MNDDRLDEVKDKLTSKTAKKFSISAGVVGAVAFVFVLLVQSRGVVNAVVYTFLFAFSAALFPTLIGLFGNAVPMAESIGKLHITLGAIAFDHHYLVQRENKWEVCPGDRGRVYIDEEWHDVEGLENYSVLGWRPFGILRYKDTETWKDKRADRKAKQLRGETATDGGGGETVERAGWKETSQPVVNGRTGKWLLDLKQAYTRGMEKIGDIELIETAEEVIERGEVDDKNRMGGWRETIEVFGGLLLGAMVAGGYIMLSG